VIGICEYGYKTMGSIKTGIFDGLGNCQLNKEEHGHLWSFGVLTK
jgi:hypothetical protein